MIDPNIILQSQTPMQLQGQALNLQQMNQNLAIGRQNMDLGDQRLQSGALDIQQQQQAASDRAALQQAIQASTSTGPDGKPFIDHDNVYKTLASTGHGLIADKYKTEITTLDEQVNRLDLTKLQLANEKTQTALGALGAVIQAPPEQKQAVWTQALQRHLQDGTIKPGQYPEQVPDDATVQSMMFQSMIPAQQIQIRLQSLAAQAAAKRADAAETRAEAYQQAVLDRDNNGRYLDTKAVSRDGHPISLDRKTGKYTVDPNVSVSLADVGGNGGGRQLTPNASAVEQRANQNDYERSATAEQAALTQRNQIGRALQQGNAYVDGKGVVKPFSQMKNAAGDPLSAQDISALQDQMRGRYQDATKAATQANAQKNAAMRRNGVQPQVNEQQFQQAMTGAQAQPPAPAPPASSGGGKATMTLGPQGLFKVDPTGRSKFQADQVVYNRQGQAVKIAGFTKDGKVIPAK